MIYLKTPRKILASTALLTALSSASYAQQPAEAATITADSSALATEQLPELKGVGAFLSLVSGLRGLDFAASEYETVLASFKESLKGDAASSEITANMQAAVQFMRDRFNAINAESELTAPNELTCKTIGYLLASQSGLAGLEFSEDEIALIAEGLQYGLDPEKDPAAIRAEIPNVQQFLSQRQSEIASRGLDERKAEMTAFFEKIATEEGVQKDESGFYFKVDSEGEGAKPTMADSVKVHYKGTLIDGTQFDSSYDRGEPATFPMTGVIKGFSGGLTKIAPGGKVTIYIPSDLGYGDNPRPGGVIKPGDALIFECELVAVNP
ncbi:MAG: FKBP-type peptidyl-prolyl cis-trans isomerase [Opitutales bacterium]